MREGLSIRVSQKEKGDRRKADPLFSCQYFFKYGAYLARVKSASFVDAVSSLQTAGAVH
jgi:hypothetical protein